MSFPKRICSRRHANREAREMLSRFDIINEPDSSDIFQFNASDPKIDSRKTPQLEFQTEFLESVINDESCSSDDDHFESQVLKELFLIKSLLLQNIKTLERIVGVLSRMKENRLGDRTTFQNNFDLPLNSMEQLEELEVKLLMTENRNSLVQSLQVLEEINFENCTKRILRKFMSDELASSISSSFSWMGCNGKRTFSSLRTLQAIFDAIRRNILFEKKSDFDIEFVVKHWLRQAKTRSKAVTSSL